MNRFENRRILVTGSTRGIGLAIAGSLLREGATVGIHGRNSARVAECCAALCPDASRTVPLAADFANPAAAAEAVTRFADAAGGIDGLVNNAGGGRAGSFRGMNLDDWRATFATNLESAMEASREAYNLMRRRKTGTIVNIASISAHGPGKWMGADYAASKAGLVSITRSLAFEAARFGIRVNAVSPSVIETDMTAMLTEEMRAGLGIPLGRLGTPGDVAGPVLYLLSDDSSYVTGQVLHVNGGLQMW
ncbi:MAG: SDR family oxidoreductase [Lentisphaerae bacterium]|nr:SDR family oxidoreductase [Lentisphaerota bacterium]